ncbi:Hydroxylysine kinase [Toxocara canis]|uniref:Hydroxylysine kinase n=1 Tax=Toxocara canis TaxID=6265 RepID=A0A0B2VJ51_TOXCA|nr:Hydroxylysine kinase [Toxocara canis]
MFEINEVTQAPVASSETIQRIVRELYSIEQCEIVRQTGYEDMNFCLQNIITPRDELRKQSKFILKITNPIEARNYDLMESQKRLCDLLREYGIPCANIYKNNEGKFWSVVEVAHNVRLPVRLFEFLNGTKLEDIDYSMQVKGLLDFGDAHYSYLIFDIAAAILYVLMDTKTNEYDDEWLKLGGWVVNGYETVHTVMDKDMLLPSMRARLALSLIYGLRTARINYRNGNLEDSTMKTHLLVTFATLAYAASENKDVPIEKCAVSIDGIERSRYLHHFQNYYRQKVANDEGWVKIPIMVADDEESVKIPIMVANDEESVKIPIMVANDEESVKIPITVADDEESCQRWDQLAPKLLAPKLPKRTPQQQRK